MHLRASTMSVLIDFLSRVQPEHHAIIQELDSLICKAAPDLVVSLKWRNPTYHSKRNACAILSHKDYVNLQVWGGAKFDDPKGLLQGTGKGMRHITFAASDRINCSAVEAIIKQASKAARA